ncbi:hypothetical protein AOL_s00132g1 [Orbilia oligospora ATCC 24927]|uniref:Uncharacterized protein n=1 Tax=Arthrobotrys oligospora (strain ATCC 24927 / CBS 115.81 / DSM 1491) TaxID=756982 RepID=G1XM31_ARTOA|nr:hypothetical protein AOL_s00132g1 [Orbilia oligospora ATCC 24927]EGX45795.1 hypothetical protein AOL_s00132g1 [Orbilia oligospora ATCC 24927]
MSAPAPPKGESSKGKDAEGETAVVALPGFTIEQTKAMMAVFEHFRNSMPTAAPTAVPSIKFPDSDPFDGTKPHELRNFLAQLNNKYKGEATKFAISRKKIAYAVSLLKENPAELAFNEYDTDDKTWNWDTYAEFTIWLKKAFENPDPTGTAEQELRNLR